MIIRDFTTKKKYLYKNGILINLKWDNEDEEMAKEERFKEEDRQCSKK